MPSTSRRILPPHHVVLARISAEAFFKAFSKAQMSGAGSLESLEPAFSTALTGKAPALPAWSGLGEDGRKLHGAVKR